MKEKKDPAILEAFFCLILLIFLRYNPRFPFAYKREAAPLPGTNHEINTQKHDTNTRLRGDRALSTRSLLPSDTWDHFPLSHVCNSYCKPSAGNTSSSKLDVGTFRPNQYKPLCPPSTPSEPDAQKQIFSLVVRKTPTILLAVAT